LRFFSFYADGAVSDSFFPWASPVESRGKNRLGGQDWPRNNVRDNLGDQRVGIAIRSCAIPARIAPLEKRTDNLTEDISQHCRNNDLPPRRSDGIHEAQRVSGEPEPALGLYVNGHPSFRLRRFRDYPNSTENFKLIATV
jgi:hypothetical protein